MIRVGERIPKFHLDRIGDSNSLCEIRTYTTTTYYKKTRLPGFTHFTFQTNKTFIHCNKIPLIGNHILSGSSLHKRLIRVY